MTNVICPCCREAGGAETGRTTSAIGEKVSYECSRCEHAWATLR